VNTLRFGQLPPHDSTMYFCSFLSIVTRRQPHLLRASSCKVNSLGSCSYHMERAQKWGLSEARRPLFSLRRSRHDPLEFIPGGQIKGQFRL
jgi:hypothetical protein